MNDNTIKVFNFLPGHIKILYVLNHMKHKDSICSKLYSLLFPWEKILLFKTIVKNRVNLNGLSFKSFALDKDVICFIKDNLDDFLILGMDIYFLKELFINDVDVLCELNIYFDKHLDRIYDLLNNCSGLTFSIEVLESYRDLLYLIILDIIKNENAKLTDIKWVCKGVFSDILFIRDKAIKIGEFRYTESFPNNPYIMKPLLRRTFELNGEKLFIEVVERGLNNCCTSDDAYEMYKKLRKIGIVWTDVKSDNVGRLEKDNVIHWRREINPSDKLLGLKPFRGEEVLKEGDLVLLDADHLYDIDNIDSEMLNNYYEIRYKKELSM